MPNSDQITDKLFQNWDELLQSFDVNQAAAEKTFTQIVESYSSPNRYHHTLEHIDRVLEVIQILESQTQNLEPKTVKLAAWFHDIVYDTSSKDNEEKSAEYAVDVLSSLSIPSDVIKNVKRLILTTKNHQAKTCVTRSVKPEAYRNAQVLLDADLAILGSNPNEYSKYTQAIRQEYIWVPEAEYIAARKQILQNFLQRENIYFTQLMQQTKEKTARNNLKTEIETRLEVKG
ncbi:MAG: HD domain-containing protein [Rivularia sp. (in: cyanobacteria)]